MKVGKEIQHAQKTGIIFIKYYEMCGVFIFKYRQVNLLQMTYITELSLVYYYIFHFTAEALPYRTFGSCTQTETQPLLCKKSSKLNQFRKLTVVNNQYDYSNKQYIKKVTNQN